MDKLVQFEEDFNSRSEMWWGWWGYRLSQTRPIPGSPDGDKNSLFSIKATFAFLEKIQIPKIGF